MVWVCASDTHPYQNNVARKVCSGSKLPVVELDCQVQLPEVEQTKYSVQASGSAITDVRSSIVAKTGSRTDGDERFSRPPVFRST